MGTPTRNLPTIAHASRVMPREKLARLGVKNLTEIELIALLLGTGTQKKPIMQLAAQSWNALKKHYTQPDRSDSATTWLAELSGIGVAKASSLIAAIELSHRLQQLLQPLPVVSPSVAFQLAIKIRHSAKEHALALFLDGQQQLLETQLIAIGGKNFAFLEPALLFHRALRLPAASLILLHNHPSGSLEPSDNDLRLTVRLKSAAELLGIGFLDHLIVSKTSYFSFKEHGLLTE